MTKAFSYLLMAAGLMLSSCVVDEQKNPYELTFTPVISADTRADEAVPFPQNRSFKVWSVDSRGGLFLDGKTISYNFGTWTSGEDWPESSLSFSACWPLELDPEFTPNGGVVIRDFVSPKDEIDILIAENVGNREDESPVNLPFQHILTRVDVRILSTLASEVSIRIHKIELVNFATHGTWNGDGRKDWEVEEADKSYTVYEAVDEAPILTNEFVYMGEDFYVIPQSCKGNFKISYDLRLPDGDWITDQTMMTTEIDQMWISGNHYTYSLKVLADTEDGGERMTFTTGISNWKNQN